MYFRSLISVSISVSLSEAIHIAMSKPANVKPADIRRRCIIRSQFGNLMIIPRERKIVRLYVQVSSSLADNYRTHGRNPEIIMQAIRKVMLPYRFDVSRIEWSTIYSVSKGPREKP